MYDNVVCFFLKEYIVVLCNCKFQIQVQVWWFFEKKDIIFFEKIKVLVEGILKIYIKYFYEVGYKCYNGVFNVEEDKFFIGESEFFVLDVLCRECDIDKKYFVSNDICWVCDM